MPAFELLWTEQADEQFLELKRNGPQDKFIKVCKTLENLTQHGPKYPGLRSHKYKSIKGPSGEDVWESYVENRTAGAWRIWWMYGPRPDVITLIKIGKHP